MTPSQPECLGEMIPRARMHEISNYSDIRWGRPGSERWTDLFVKLERYVPPPKTLSLSADRKWELVSALQKAIRRADKETSLRLISAMAATPKEFGYFWKRLCVIACEDVGLADDELATFVVACSTVFLPAKTGVANYGLLCFLAEQMCEVPHRSRIYCSLAVIDDVATKFGSPALSSCDRLILAAIKEQKNEIREAKFLWTEWRRRNNWRAEGMLQYLGIALGMTTSVVAAPIPECKTICSLPSYCYDMHTRAGLAALKSIVAGTEGAEAIYYFFKRHRVRTPHIALGWALFFIEGGRIAGELVCEELSDLEQRVIAYQFGLPLEAWRELRTLLCTIIDGGVLDRERDRVSYDFYERPRPQSGNLFDRGTSLEEGTK